MRIDIFQLSGMSPTAAFDEALVRIRTAFPHATIRAVDMRDMEAMQAHPDVVDALRTRGMDAFPMFKVDGKLLSFRELQKRLNIYEDERLPEGREELGVGAGF